MPCHGCNNSFDSFSVAVLMLTQYPWHSNISFDSVVAMVVVSRFSYVVLRCLVAGVTNSMDDWLCPTCEIEHDVDNDQSRCFASSNQRVFMTLATKTVRRLTIDPTLYNDGLYGNIATNQTPHHKHNITISNTQWNYNCSCNFAYNASLMIT